MAAGASTGLLVDVVLFPLDLLKTRIQGLPRAAPSPLSSPSKASSSSVSAIFQSGGFSAFYKGIGALALGSVPSSAIFFGVYECAKTKLAGSGGESQRLSYTPYLQAVLRVKCSAL